MKTKHLIKFLNNAAHYDADLEFVDIIQKSVSSGNLKTDTTQYIFDHIDNLKHKKLAARANSQHSRTLAANHLKSSFRAAFIKNIYEAATTYLQDILKAATKKGTNSDRLLAEHTKTFTSKEILQIGSYPKLLTAIGASLFRQLENEKSTKALIEKMVKRLGLTINPITITDALPYFELRHCLVHAEGKTDKHFCENFPSLNAEVDKTYKLTYETTDNARTSIIALIKTFDEQIVLHNLVQPSDLQP